MNKKIILGAFVAITVLVGLVLWVRMSGNSAVPPEQILSDYKNTTYLIERQPVTLVNGRAETPSAPASASKTVTQYFGNEASGDLNGDGIPDVGFILTQDTGGSGKFYYAVAALKTANGYQGTNAVLLGDRIAPQTTAITNGQLIVNYADHKSDEPMSALPSVGVSKYLKVEGAMLMVASAPAAPLPGVVNAGEHCGGNMRTAAVCAAGSHCAPTPGSHLPFGDVGGTCVADLPQQVVLPYGNVTLALNQSAKFKNISIRPVAIEEDSRCPSDVQCIQAGTVRVGVDVDAGMGSSASVLELGKVFITEGEAITLMNVLPVKKSKTTVKASEYRFVFNVVQHGVASNPSPKGKCYVGGCSSQLCTDKPDMISTCEYSEKYACYKSATCERQSNGECGWTQTATLTACLAN